MSQNIKQQLLEEHRATTVTTGQELSSPASAKRCQAPGSQGCPMGTGSPGLPITDHLTGAQTVLASAAKAAGMGPAASATLLPNAHQAAASLLEAPAAELQGLPLAPRGK